MDDDLHDGLIPIACDIETADLSAKYDPSTPIWCIGFAGWDENGNTYQMSEEWEQGKKRLREYIDSGQYKFIFHNAPFDVATLRLRGFDIRPGYYEDTMLRAYLLQPAAKELHSLEAWGERLDCPKMDYRSALVDSGLLAEDAPKAAEYAVPWNPVMAQYNCQDLETTQALFEYTEVHFSEDPRVQWCYYNVELPYEEVIMEMEQGCYIDDNKLRELGEILKPKIDSSLEAMQTIARFVPGVQWDAKLKKYVPKVVTYSNKERINGKMVRNEAGYWVFKEGGDIQLTSYKRNLTPLGKVTSKKNQVTHVHNLHYTYVYDHCEVEPINPNSNTLAWYLMEFCGWKPTVKTKTGQPKTSADIVGDIDHIFVKTYKEYIDCEKLYGTFVVGLLDARKPNGLVYGSYNQTTTRTCRLSAEKPNLQNIPARSDLGKVIREAFVAPPGYTLAIADLDRIEVVVLAFYLEYLFGDSRMADAVRAGLDVHAANADAWFPDVEDRDRARRMAKDTIFAVLYGIMAKSLSTRLGVSPEQAENILNEVNERMPAIMDAKEWVWATCKKRRKFKWIDIFTDERATHGFMYDLVGHRLHYPDISSPNEFERARAQRQAFNALIQGSAGGIMKLLHLQVFIAMRGLGRCMLAVHDENGVYLKNEVLYQKEESILKYLTDSFSSVRLLVTDKGSIPVRGEFQIGNNWKEAK